MLDPFMGSGTTLIAANRLRRSAVGIDIVPEYCDRARRQLRASETYLLEVVEIDPLSATGRSLPIGHCQ